MRSFLLALTALSVVALPNVAVAQSVGVTAAVNQAARGTQPNAGVRTIAIGDNVIYNERIDTDAGGLVQILLADGTTFTVGPNSGLVIDSFVYDPAAGTAQVAATMTRGVLRFIGGATSKTPNGVNLNTPVGTVGIRGAVTDINLNPSPGIPPHISLIFGSEVTVNQGAGEVGRLYQAGYSLVFGAGGGVEVQRTPPGWTSEVQSALAGKPGTSGGAPIAPTSQKVAESGVPENNSQQSVGENAPPPPLPPVSPEEAEQLVVAAAVYEENRTYIVDNPRTQPNPPDPPYQPVTFYGAGAGVIEYSSNGYDVLHPAVTTAFSNSSAALTSIVFDENGNPVAGVIDITSIQCADCRLIYDNDGTSTTATISGVYTTDDEYTVAATGSLVDHSAVTLPGGVDYCVCDFIKWGFWSVDATVTGSSGQTTDFAVNNGTWVVGGITSSSDLDGLGVAELAGTHATYDGHAIGTVALFDGSNAMYTAAGDLSMDWSFASRQGSLAINGLDGRDFAGAMSMDAGSPYFGGPLAGTNNGGNGFAAGGFASDGTTPAAGVMGDFGVFDGTWTATGVFLGERGADVPN